MSLHRASVICTLYRLVFYLYQNLYIIYSIDSQCILDIIARPQSETINKKSAVCNGMYSQLDAGSSRELRSERSDITGLQGGNLDTAGTLQ